MKGNPQPPAEILKAFDPLKVQRENDGLDDGRNTFCLQPLDRADGEIK